MSTAPDGIDLEREQPVWLLALVVAATIAGSTAAALLYVEPVAYAERLVARYRLLGAHRG